MEADVRCWRPSGHYAALAQVRAYGCFARFSCGFGDQLFSLLPTRLTGGCTLLCGESADVGLPIPEKSIAVLPFENRSEEKANAYFADGIQEEILTRLSKIADLKVISRTSTQHYKSAPENLREIAKQIGDAHILEGS